MKKTISTLLCVAMLMQLFVISAFANSDVQEKAAIQMDSRGVEIVTSVP